MPDLANSEYQQRTQSPGALLKKAREAKGWRIADIAKRTHLSAYKIEDIEEDRFDRLKAEIYVRGYLRCYARAVGLDESVVKEAFDAMEYEFPTDTADRLMPLEDGLPVYSHGRSPRSSLIKWSGALVGVVLLLMVMMWWYGQSNQSTSAINQSQSAETNSLAPQAQTASLTPAAPEGVSDAAPQANPSANPTVAPQVNSNAVPQQPVSASTVAKSPVAASNQAAKTVQPVSHNS